MGPAPRDDTATRRTQVTIALISAVSGIVIALISLYGVLAATGRQITTTEPSPAVTVTVPGPVVTETVPGAAADASPSDGSSSAPANAVLLADSSTSPDGVVVGNTMSQATNLAIDGKTFDFGWVRNFDAFTSPGVMVGVNTNQAYSRFQARIGLASTSANSLGKVVVLMDGKEVKAYAVDLTHSFDVNLPITGIQRVEIKGLAATDQLTYAVGGPVLLP